MRYPPRQLLRVQPGVPQVLRPVPGVPSGGPTWGTLHGRQIHGVPRLTITARADRRDVRYKIARQFAQSGKLQMTEYVDNPD